MARSLDSLIDYLLGEIALSGQQGCTPSQVLCYINQFYATTDQNGAGPASQDGQEAAQKPTVDRPVQERVWQWLTQHPDISVGERRKGNNFSLAEIERCHNAAVTGEILAVQASPSKHDNSTVTAGQNVQSTKMNVSRPPEKSKNGALKVFVSEERMYLAICGHVRDVNRIFDMEFALLSVIASHREAGILQGDLVRQSGQDKRTVPKRTDRLHEKGYIDKRAVQVKGYRTSRLILTKFATTADQKIVIEKKSAATENANQPSNNDESIDFQVLISRVFDVLQNKPLVTRTDMKRSLGMNSLWRSRVLSRLIREFEVIGCLKRVRANSKESHVANVQWHYDCVKFIRAPTDADLQAYFRADSGVNVISAAPSADSDGDGGDGDQQVGDASILEPKDLEEVERVIPQWNPDRHMPNLLLDVVDSAGTSGASNETIRNNSLGSFMERPLENAVARLSRKWALSQPAHLKHLAIVRDTAMTGTVAHYIHYSYPKFSELVENGQAFWEAVGVAEKPSTSKKLKSEAVMEPVEYDRFGFPKHQHPPLQYKNGRCTLGEALKAGKPGTFEFTNFNAARLRDDPEQEPIPKATQKTSARPIAASTSPMPSSSQISNPLSAVAGAPRRPKSHTLGRPRKFFRGTEQFWQIQFRIVHGVQKTQAGVMSNPAGLAMFARRPPDFDSVLVQALQNDLPVPEKPEKINPDWIARVHLILDRQSKGIYIAPVGYKVRKGRIALSRSQTIIFRYGKLRDPDFFKPRPVPLARFIASSAAHTFAHYHHRSWIFSWASTPEARSKSPTPSTAGRVLSGSQLVQHGPKASVFGNRLPASHLPPSSLHVLPQASVEEQFISEAVAEIGAARASPSRTIDPGTAFPSETRPAIFIPYMQPSAAGRLSPVPKTQSSTKSYDLPPPLTTRAASRRQSKQTSSNSESPYRPQRPLSQSLRKRKERSFAAESPPTQERGNLAVDPVNMDTDEDRRPLQSLSVRQGVNGGQDRFPRINNVPNSVPALPASEETGAITAPVTSSALGDSLEWAGASNPFPTTLPAKEAPDLTTTQPMDHEVAQEHEVNQRILEAQQIIDELSGGVEEDAARSSSALRPERNSEGDEEVADPSRDIPGITQLDPDDDQPQSKKGPRNGVSGGSVGFLRRKIMLDLVERCGGAVPSNIHTLWNAFASYWQRAGHAGKPDNRTIAAAMKSLCDNGKLKKMKFAHKDKNGVMITKEILARPNLSPTDPIIRELQKSMIDSHPMPYISPGMAPDPSIPKYARRVEAGRLQPQHMTEVIDTFVESEEVAAAFTLLEARQAAAAVREQRRRNRGKPVIRLDSINRPLISNQAGRAGAYHRLKFPLSNYSTRPTSVARPTVIAEESNIGIASLQLPLTFDAHIAGQSPAPHENSQTTDKVVPNIPHPRTNDSALIFPSPGNAGRIIWKPSAGYLQLPTSLGDIISHLPGRRKNLAKQPDPRLSRFFSEVDAVAKWEERSFHYFEVTAPQWTFINHMFGSHDEAMPLSDVQLTWTGLTKFDGAGKEHIALSEVQPTTPHNLTNEAIHEASDDTEYIADTLTGSRKRKRPGKRGGPCKKRKRDVPPTFFAYPDGTQHNAPSHGGIPSRKPRGQQHLRNMTEAAIYRLTVAIVLVRTLAGGLDKVIDWPIVMSLFPDDNLQYMRDRWRTLRNKFRKDIAGLTENLQEQFCAAYLRNEVPGLNFENLAATDWEGILAWALKTLSRPKPQGVEDLPATRTELVEEKDFMFEEQRGWREFLGYNVAATVPMRETAAATIPFSCPTVTPSATRQSPHSLHTPRPSTPTSSLAQSYVLSTILTPEQAFRPQAALDRLSSLAPTVSASNALLDSAIKSLSSSKTIIRSREAVPAGLSTADPHPRLHAVSKLFHETLSQRRPINRILLIQAAEYKLKALDSAFASAPNSLDTRPRLPFDPNVTDGAMTAILQLYAHRRLRIAAGPDVPQSRYGWGYQTRKLEKAALRFTVLLEPSGTPAVEVGYVYGNPLAERTFPPVPGFSNSDTALIPIWMTIHGSLNVEMWELVVASVLGIIAQRPGVGAVEIAKTLRPAVQGTWEAKEVLEWCEAGGIVKRTRRGGAEDESVWEVQEWWWMVLADDTF